MTTVVSQPGAPVAPAAMISDAAAWAAEDASKRAAAAPPPPPPQPPPSVDAKATADLLVWVLDKVLVELMGQGLKLKPDELADLKEKATPVVAIYLPPELLMGPVGALVLTAGAIYGTKLMKPPAPATETVEAKAEPAPAEAA